MRQRRKKEPDYWRIIWLMVFFSVLWHIWLAPFWLIHEVRPFGASHYSTRYVLNYLSSHQLTGKHILSINPMQIRRELLNFALLKEVRVERTLFPTLLNLYLTERKPAFRIYEEISGGAYQSSRSFLIDDEGVVLNIPDAQTPPHTVLVSIDKTQLRAGRLDQEHLSLLLLLNTLYQNKQLLAQGVYNISRPDQLILRPSEGSPPVWLGRAEQLSLKLRLLPSLEEIAKKNNQRVSYFDLRNWENPVIKIQ